MLEIKADSHYEHGAAAVNQLPTGDALANSASAPKLHVPCRVPACMLPRTHSDVSCQLRMFTGTGRKELRAAEQQTTAASASKQQQQVLAAATEQPAALPERQQQQKLALGLDTRFPSSGITIHTLCTSNGSPYLNFQTRIM